MQASWVKDTTATTGTGTITLDGTPDSGFIGFDDAFSTGDAVHYTIEDGNNRETGIGTLTSGASWTLSRGQILETLSSGVYAQWPATGINLSGSATVAIAPSAASTISPAKGYTTGTTYYNGSDLGAVDSSTTVAVTANRMYIIPLILLVPRKVSKLMCYVATADAGATVSRVGLYKVNASGQPETLIEDGTVDVTSTGGKILTLASTYYLNPGSYATAFATDGTPSLRGIGAGEHGGNMYGRYFTTGQSAYAYKALSSWSALPSTISSPTVDSGGAVPFVMTQP